MSRDADSKTGKSSKTSVRYFCYRMLRRRITKGEARGVCMVFHSAICTNVSLHVRIDISRSHAFPPRDTDFDLRRFAGLLLSVRFRIASRRL